MQSESAKRLEFRALFVADAVYSADRNGRLLTKMRASGSCGEYGRVRG